MNEHANGISVISKASLPETDQTDGFNKAEKKPDASSGFDRIRSSITSVVHEHEMYAEHSGSSY